MKILVRQHKRKGRIVKSHARKRSGANKLARTWIKANPNTIKENQKLADVYGVGNSGKSYPKTGGLRETMSQANFEYKDALERKAFNKKVAAAAKKINPIRRGRPRKPLGGYTNVEGMSQTKIVKNK